MLMKLIICALSLAIVINAKDADGSQFSVPLVPKVISSDSATRWQGYRMNLSVISGCAMSAPLARIDVYADDVGMNAAGAEISVAAYGVGYVDCDPEDASRKLRSVDPRAVARRDSDQCCAYDTCSDNTRWDAVTVGNNITVRTEVFADVCWGDSYTPDGSFAILSSNAGTTEFTKQACASVKKAPVLSVAVSIEPSVLKSHIASLDYCGVNASHFVWPINYHPLSRIAWPDITAGLSGLTLGNKSLLSHTSTRIKFDPTLHRIYLPDDTSLKTYLNLTGAKKDGITGFLTVTKTQFLRMPPLHFLLDNQTYTVSADAQLWPQSRNHEIGGNDTAYYLNIAPDVYQGYYSPIISVGSCFFERFYIDFKTDSAGNFMVGVAKTHYTEKTLNCY